MGCCLSTKNTKTKPHLCKNNPNSRAPPPSHPLVDEETIVKEVLSETPISIVPQNECPKNPLMHSSPNSKLQQDDVVLKEPKIVVSNTKLPPFQELSEEASESCISTATETKNFADDDNDVTQIRTQSPAKNRNRQVSGDRLVGRTSGRVGSDPSPGRVRPGSLRDGRCQNSNGVRRGAVMGPDRRSRSPVTRVDGGGLRSGLSRCPSGRRTGKSPGRFGPVELVEKNSKIERSDPEVDPTNEESLENPLVSLECFIFL